jgi:glycosyltransferase involved in cell wall biosynthesis
MTSRVGLILPALDEEAAVGATLSGFAGCSPAQVIVADNGSRDRTAEVAQAHGARVVREPRRGYGHACLAAIAALDPSVDIVVFADADGSDDPADLPALVSPIERGEADMVIGSRVRGRSEPGALSLQQRLGNRLATALLRLLHGASATDLGPFRAIRRDSLARLDMRDTNFGWTVEMQIKARQKGLRVLEIPVRYRRRRSGQSKVSRNLRGSALAGAKILWTILRYRFSD